MSTMLGRIQLSEMLSCGILYRRLLENLPYRIYVKDTFLTYVFCNEAYSRYFSITPDKIYGKTDYDLFSRRTAEAIITVENEILHSGEQKEITEKHVVAGRESFTLATKIPLRNDSGDVIGLQVVQQDITKEKRRTESLAFLIKSLENLVAQREKKSHALKINLERVTGQLNQRDAEFKELQEKATKEKYIFDDEIERLNDSLQRETIRRLNLLDLLQKFFVQFQDQIKLAKHLTDRTVRNGDQEATTRQ